jgi:transcriptional regulator with XRE-family HTH domain
MSINIRLKLGSRIRQLRKKNGFTQEKLAGTANIDYKYIQRIEGRKPPALRIDTLEKLANAFGISISKLLDFK